MEKNELQKSDAVSPLAAAAQLCQNNEGMDVAKLKELLDLQERWDATQAKKAYTQAMSEFKANPPEIFKDKSVSYKQTKYSHASLHNVAITINVELSKHGFAASWITSQDNGSVKVTCRITHVMGHSEETCLAAPPDATGSKNAIQAIGSTVTYLQRYTILALTGLATHDQDDDGAGADEEPVKQKEPTTKEQNIITQVAAKLSQHAPKNKVVDEEKLANKMWMLWTCYPNDETKIAATVKHFINYNLVEAVCKDLPGKAVFKWKCNSPKCGLGFDDPGGNEANPICPNTKCLSADIEMVIAE